MPPCLTTTPKQAIKSGERLSNIALEGEHGFREEAIQQGSKRAGEKEM